MIHPAFFGYQDLPDLIELNDNKLIPIKALRIKYHGKSQSTGVFSVENIRSLCNLLGIQLHRPVRGLYCIEDRYSNFFDRLYNFYMKEVSSFIHHSGYFYSQSGDLIWGIYNHRTGEMNYQKKCDFNMIEELFYCS